MLAQAIAGLDILLCLHYPSLTVFACSLLYCLLACCCIACLHVAVLLAYSPSLCYCSGGIVCVMPHCRAL